MTKVPRVTSNNVPFVLGDSEVPKILNLPSKYEDNIPAIFYSNETNCSFPFEGTAHHFHSCVRPLASFSSPLYTPTEINGVLKKLQETSTRTQYELPKQFHFWTDNSITSALKSRLLNIYIKHIKFKIISAWDVALCSPVEIRRCFGGNHSLHLQ